MNGAASDTSCGATGPVAVLSQITRKYGSAVGVNSCPDVEVGDVTLSVSELLMVGMYADSICVKNDGVFCLTEVLESGLPQVLQILGMDDPPTKESLDSMCSP